MKADAIYINGNIYTVDDYFSMAKSIAVKGDKIIYVGDNTKALYNITGESTKMVDLEGETVIPGLIEGHMHFLSEGQISLNINAFKLSKEKIIHLVKEKAESLSPGEWIEGTGWNQMEWPNQAWPTKEELDTVSPDNPVVLHRVDLHCMWVNSRALKAAGITKNAPDLQGGEIVKDKNGNITGILVDTARQAVFDAIPPLTDDMKLKAYALAQEECFYYGLTSIFDAGSTFEEIGLLKKAYNAGKLKLRVYETLLVSDDSDVKYIESGLAPVKELFNNRLSINAVKIFADGSVGSRSAMFFDDYADRPGHKGKGIYTDEALYKLVRRAGENGFQVATHAIGDAAIRQVMDTYEKVLNELSLRDARFRIEHFLIPTPSDVPRAVKLGIVPTLQAGGAISDMGMLKERLGAARVGSGYVWREIIEAGGYFVGGSDATVDILNPYYGIYAGVARDGRYEDYRLTREEALRSYTIWAAKGQFEESIKGSLEVGKLADFVVIDRDIMTCPLADMKETQVLLTVLGGEVVYKI